MRRTFSTLISTLLICCLCTGVTVHAQETAEGNILAGGQNSEVIAETDSAIETVEKPQEDKATENETEVKITGEEHYEEEKQLDTPVQSEDVKRPETAESPIQSEDIMHPETTESPVQSEDIMHPETAESPIQSEQSEIMEDMEQSGQSKTAVVAQQVIQAAHQTPVAVAVAAQTTTKKTIRILMVGNSMTVRKGNTTIKNLRQMAKKSGMKVVIKYLKDSDEKMVNWANPKSKNGKRLYRQIRSNRWDYIVFQEQTQAATKRSFVNASEKIGKYIQSTSPKTQIIYNCTWAYKKGKKISGKFYSYSAMQNVMNQNYQTAAEKTGGRVCWSGKAFQLYRKGKGKKKNLYGSDNNHASKYGWYLNSCCLYRGIFGNSATKIKYYGGLGKKLAKKLQKIADKAMV